MAKVGIIMGSESDLPVMQEAIDILKEFDIETEVDIVSAHRTPEKMMDYGNQAHQRGLKAIIAGAGGAAHLPGMIASVSPLPVIGVPVATVALNGAKNAGILAAQILGTTDSDVLDSVVQYKKELKTKVINSSKKLNP